MIYDVFADLLVPSSPGEGEVVQAGDAEHGVVDAVAIEAAVAEGFQVFIRAKACSTRARTLRCEVLCSSFHGSSSLWPGSRRCGMTGPVRGGRRPR
jgi:hypothetical protein